MGRGEIRSIQLNSRKGSPQFDLQDKMVHEFEQGMGLLKNSKQAVGEREHEDLQSGVKIEIELPEIVSDRNRQGNQGGEGFRLLQTEISSEFALKMKTEDLNAQTYSRSVVKHLRKRSLENLNLNQMKDKISPIMRSPQPTPISKNLKIGVFRKPATSFVNRVKSSIEIKDQTKQPEFEAISKKQNEHHAEIPVSHPFGLVLETNPRLAPNQTVNPNLSKKLSFSDRKIKPKEKKLSIPFSRIQHFETGLGPVLNWESDREFEPENSPNNIRLLASPSQPRKAYEDKIIKTQPNKIPKKGFFKHMIGSSNNIQEETSSPYKATLPPPQKTKFKRKMSSLHEICSQINSPRENFGLLRKRSSLEEKLGALNKTSIPILSHPILNAFGSLNATNTLASPKFSDSFKNSKQISLIHRQSSRHPKGSSLTPRFGLNANTGRQSDIKIEISVSKCMTLIRNKFFSELDNNLVFQRNQKLFGFVTKCFDAILESDVEPKLNFEKEENMGNARGSRRRKMSEKTVRAREKDIIDKVKDSLASIRFPASEMGVQLTCMNLLLLCFKYPVLEQLLLPKLLDYCIKLDCDLKPDDTSASRGFNKNTRRDLGHSQHIRSSQQQSEFNFPSKSNFSRLPGGSRAHGQYAPNANIKSMPLAMSERFPTPSKIPKPLQTPRTSIHPNTMQGHSQNIQDLSASLQFLNKFNSKVIRGSKDSHSARKMAFKSLYCDRYSLSSSSVVFAKRISKSLISLNRSVLKPSFDDKASRKLDSLLLLLTIYVKFRLQSASSFSSFFKDPKFDFVVRHFIKNLKALEKEHLAKPQTISSDLLKDFSQLLSKSSQKNSSNHKLEIEQTGKKDSTNFSNFADLPSINSRSNCLSDFSQIWADIEEFGGSHPDYQTLIDTHRRNLITFLVSFFSRKVLRLESPNLIQFFVFICVSLKTPLKTDARPDKHLFQKCFFEKLVLDVFSKSIQSNSKCAKLKYIFGYIDNSNRISPDFVFSVMKYFCKLTSFCLRKVAKKLKKNFRNVSNLHQFRKLNQFKRMKFVQAFGDPVLVRVVYYQSRLYESKITHLSSRKYKAIVQMHRKILAKYKR